MGEVYFYHLTRSPTEAMLPPLLTRALAQGWRVEVRGIDPARMDWLDERLWLGDPAAFLPHGRAGGPHDARQPVLLTHAPAAAGDRDCVVALDGADLSPDEVGPLARACLIFDGEDEAALAGARDQWRALTAAGHGAQYWSQADGRWAMKRRAEPA